MPVHRGYSEYIDRSSYTEEELLSVAEWLWNWRNEYREGWEVMIDLAQRVEARLEQEEKNGKRKLEEEKPAKPEKAKEANGVETH